MMPVLVKRLRASLLVTAWHVFFDDSDNLRGSLALLRSHASDPHEQMRSGLELALKSLKASDNWKEDLTHDVLAIRLENNSKPTEGVRITHQPKSGPAKMPLTTLLKFSELGFTKPVYLVGYRVSRAIKDPTGFSLNIPEIRKGRVLAKDKKSGQFVADYRGEPGDSGAPVFIIDRSEAGNTTVDLAGLYFGSQQCHDDKRELWCALATPTDYILQLISSFK